MITMTELANELGSDWQASEEDQHVDNVNSGMPLYVHSISYGKYGGRIKISLSVKNPLYRELRHNESIPSITVNGSRTIESIVADIRSRLLPKAIKTFDVLVERAEASRKYQVSKLSFRSALLAALGKADDGQYHGHRDIYEYISGSRVEIDCYADTANLEISHVSRETATAICEILRNGVAAKVAQE